jgi:hypothetical protein
MLGEGQKGGFIPSDLLKSLSEKMSVIFLYEFFIYSRSAKEDSEQNLRRVLSRDCVHRAERCPSVCYV